MPEQKKTSRRRKPTNVAMESQKDEPSCPAVRNLLAQLANAQGQTGQGPSSPRTPKVSSNAVHGHQAKAVPSTPSSSSKKVPRGRKHASESENTSSFRPKAPSVGARMTNVTRKTSNMLTFQNQNFANYAEPLQSKPFYDEKLDKSKKSRTRHHSHSFTQNRPPASPQKPGTYQSFGPKIPEDVLDDLCFRFLLNIPEDEQRNEIRICFQIELALWFYIDYYCRQKEREDCRELGMREFTRQIFANCDFLKNLSRNVDEVVDMWRHYKSNVPTYGAILLDSSLNYVLLVQGYYSNANSWGFPKGKVNESEHPRKCAIREVYEETGYDFGLTRPTANEHRLQKFIGDTMTRLYIVPDVQIDYPFAPTTRFEIRKIQWFNVWDLPTERNDKSTVLSANHFYSVYPFVQELHAWIRQEQSRRARALNKSNKGPQGKVAVIRSQERGQGGAFTPVVPKTVNEKLDSAMNLLKNPESPSNSSPREQNKLMQPSDKVFKPVPTAQSTFSVSSFMQLWSAGTSLTSPPQSTSAQTFAAPIAYPTPLKPNTDKPVYVAPREQPIQKKKSQPPGGQYAKPSAPVDSLVSAVEMEAALHQLLMGTQSSETMETANDQSQDPLEHKEVRESEDTGSTTSIVMAQELPMVAAIERAEQEAAFYAQRQHKAAVDAIAVAARQVASQQIQNQNIQNAHLQHQAMQQQMERNVNHVQHQPHANVFHSHANEPSSSSVHAPFQSSSSMVSHNPAVPHTSAHHYTPIVGGGISRSRQVSLTSERLSSPYSKLPVQTPPRDLTVYGSHNSLASTVLMSPPTVSQNGAFVASVPAIRVRPCEAWNSFKIDTEAILAAINGISVS